MKKFLITESEKNDIRKLYSILNESDDPVIRKRCFEYNLRTNKPVTANSCDIQTFLINIGYNLKQDCDFGNNTASAYATFRYGAAENIKTLYDLWKRMRKDGLDVGETSGFGPKMANSVAKEINRLIPKLSKNCQTKKINLTLAEITDQDCMNKIKPSWNNSITWWKNKLNERAFYEKIKRINGWDDVETKFWIDAYKEHLTTKLRGPYCLKKSYDKLYDGSSGTIAYATWHSVDIGNVINKEPSFGCKVSYNTKFKDESATDIESTMVHEIQHCLYDVKPMTPHTSWKKVFPKATWGTEGSTKSESNVKYTNNEKYGINADIIKKWESYLKNSKQTYTCEETENASRINGLKKLLGYKTNQKITVNDFKKFLNEDKFPYDDEQAYWLCLCWVKNGAQDIKTFLDNLDKYVVAKNDQEGDDINKDEVT